MSDVFAVLLARNGPPPLWRRPASFPTLVRLILEQQVSLASANAAYRRLDERLDSVTPEAVLTSTDAELKLDGFSHQKAGYVRGIASLIVEGDFEPERVGADGADAFVELVAIRGIGPWTASCFALFALGEADIWPTGDRALHVSMARNLDLDVVPDSEAASATALHWQPHRSTAARMLWHDYLGGHTYVQSPDAGFL
jgi:DNA-3-methyladenine glycosylase II